MRPEAEQRKGVAEKKRKRKLRQWATIGVLVVACAVVGKGAWGMWATFSRARSEAHVSQMELAKVEERSVRASNEVAKMEDSFGKEAALRSRFDVGLPGEQLLVIIDEDHPEIAPVVPITWLDRVCAFVTLCR